MGRKFLSLRGERGDASIFLSMILALGVGTAVYYNMDKLNQTLKSSKVTGQKQKAETRNISSLSMATALMSFSGTDADQPAQLPYIYPDPYLGGGSTIGTPRAAPNVDTWSFANMNLEVASPADGELTSASFAAYATGGNRPKLSSHSKIRFTKPVFDLPANPQYIKAYEAEVTSQSFDSQQLTNKATIEVPRPQAPKCILRSADGQNRFQPNSTFRLELLVSGIAAEAWVPADADALLAPRGVLTYHTAAGLGQKAGSVRFTKKVVHSWVVTAPRPLVAVDGQTDVEFEAFAYLQRADVANKDGEYCSFKYYVAPPAFCKLWSDKASVAPGQCVNISSEYQGPVQANSLVMSATDPTGKAVAGLNQFGNSGTFCTPASNTYSTGVAVSPASAAQFGAAVSALNEDQKRALWEELNRLADDLKLLFPASGKKGKFGGGVDLSILRNLSFNQFNDLWSLDPSDLKNMESVDLSTFTYLSTLTQDQKDALQSMDEDDFEDLEDLSQRFLKIVSLLDTVDVTILNQLESYDSRQLQAYVGQLLDAASNATAGPVNYKITGTIKALDGTSNSCLVHVTAGTNKCPFFGPKFPNHSQTQTLTIVSGGNVGTMNFDFTPSKPNWEVAGVATSPTKMQACPNGARCFAVDIGGNRTPFTVVDSADSASCNATTNMRVDLGCFEANTKIRMGDGTEKPIRQLKDNDLVWNPVRQKAVAIRRVTPGPEKLPLLSIETDSGLVRVTAKHPFLTPSGIRAADELRTGDRILGSKGEERIKSARSDSSAPSEWVWNFELVTDSKDPADHAILADGVVTGDLYLQERLSQGQTNKLSELQP